MFHPRASFNASGFTDGNLISLVEKIFPAEWSAGQRKLVVHIDNTPADNLKITQNFFEHNSLKRLL
jgi:hypothetical protein